MNLPTKKVLFGTITLLFYPAFSHAENSQWVEWIADVEAAYTQVNNLNYSAFSNDENDDDRLALTAVLGRYYQLSGNSRMHVAVEFSTEDYDQFSLMGNTEVGANLGVRHKFGLGHNVPYLQFTASYRHQEVKADPWSNNSLAFNLEVGKHLTDKLTLAASLTYTSVDGGRGEVIVPEISSAVFDQSFWHADIYADYILSANWLLSLNYGRREGDFHSACTVENVNIVLDTMQVKAITSDTIFGGCVYQVDGSNNSYSSNISYAITDHSALNLSIEHFRGNANSLSYRGNNIQLSYNYRY